MNTQQDRLRKRDLSIWYSSAATWIPIAAMVLFFVLGLAGYGEGMHIGIIDGAVGLVAGILLAIPAQRSQPWVEAIRERRDGRVRLWDPNGFRQLPPILLAVAISWATGALGHYILHLRWPLIGDQPTILPAIFGYGITACYYYIRWYDSLPE